MDTTDRTDRLALPYLAGDQAQKHVTINEGLRALDALIHVGVLSAASADQPAAPAPGDAYLMPEQPSGPAWSGFAPNDLAVLQDGAWAAFAPVLGMTAWVADEGIHRVWDGAAWIVAHEGAGAAGMGGGGSTPAPAQTSAEHFGINATADDTNRLIVKSDAVLHTHDDASGQGSGDARHAINKATPANTASLVFQSGFSGRAEMGLTGSDDFAFKVSGDGSTFVDAITIDRATGAVSLPNTPATPPPSGAVGGPDSRLLTGVVASDLAKTDDNTLTPIAGMSGIVLPAGSVWRIDAGLHIDGDASTDFALGVDVDQPDAAAYVNEAEQRSRFGPTDHTGRLRLATEPNRRGTANLVGVVTAGAAPTTFGLSWAQHFAGPAPTRIRAASTLVLTRVDGAD